MLEYFIHKKHGAVSVMLAVLLAAVLSFGSSLMEIARYRSLQGFYKEVTENTGFSILSHYDRDLYKNFGLLAIEQDVDEQELIRYLRKNLEGLESELSMTGADKPLKAGTDVRMDKLYQLNEKEVLQAQIMEFCSYRAPISLVNNTLNIEEALDTLASKLKDALPILKMLEKLSMAAEQIVDSFLKLSEYSEQAKVLQKAIEEYETQVGNYNAAISERDSYAEDHEEDEEGYADGLTAKNNAVAEQAVVLREKIENTKEELGTYHEKYTAFVTAFDAMQSANVEAILEGAELDIADMEDKKAKESAETMLKEMKAGYKNSESLCKNMMTAMDNISEAFVLASQEKLSGQLTELTGEGKDLKQTAVLPVVRDNFLWTALRMCVGTLEQLVRIVDSWADALSRIADVLQAMEIVFTGGTYDIEYNNQINDGLWNRLPGQANGGRLPQAENPYAAQDEAAMQEKLADAEKIADASGFDLDSLHPVHGIQEMNMLQNAMDRMKNAETAFRDKCAGMQTKWGIFGVIEAFLNLASVIPVLIEYIASLIHLAETFISVSAAGMLPTLLYQKTFAAVYASDMFSNRATAGDKRLNGSSLPDYSTYSVNDECFDMANTEYILAGKNSERGNQEDVFYMILVLRVLCNIPAILTDATLMSTVADLCATIIGIVAAVILIGVMLFIEAWADMVFMIYGDEGVDIIKLKGYFAWDGSGGKELNDKVADVLKTIGKKKEQKPKNPQNPQEQEDEKNIVQQYGKGLLKWDYKDHLFLMLLLFTSSDTIYARSADLIEMQMRMEKKLSGEITEFRLDEMSTYIRVEAVTEYTPLLPIPSVPGLNDKGIKMKTMYYSGY